MNTFYIIRGLPGSGKSTMALKLVSKDRHFETDQFWEQKLSGKFDGSRLKEAHAWNKDRVQKACMTSREDLAVSNTFTVPSEYWGYIHMAQDHGFVPVVLTMENDFGSIHNVPQETIERMRKRMTAHNPHDSFWNPGEPA